MQIYAGHLAGGPARSGADKIVAFVSEFHPAPAIIHPLATAILDWVQEQRCSLLVSPEGLVVEALPNASRASRTPHLTDVKVYGVASTRKARELYIEPNMIPFAEGVITGIAGVLLNEGRRRGFDVLTFLAEAQADYPDARAAAKVIETINRILLRTPLDPVPLYAEAERIEQQLLSIQKHAAERSRTEPSPPSSQPMSRWRRAPGFSRAAPVPRRSPGRRRSGRRTGRTMPARFPEAPAASSRSGRSACPSEP